MLLVKKKANQKLNARMTESVCYVITSQLFSHRCAPAHLRSSSCGFGDARPYSARRGRAQRQVGRERRPGAACGLDSCVAPAPRGSPLLAALALPHYL
ncbi:unnamed protein product [Leptosia nina]|uniref:Uncharacterized protein n=1 Tax=Leptosia nina TaxID=320188 RepID=A0AAV1JAV6_9NEOP